MNGDGVSTVRMISFVADGVFSTVLDSQIVVPLAFIGRHAPHVHRAALILSSFRHKRDPKLGPRESAIRDALPGAKVLFRYRPILGTPCEQRFWAASLRSALAECGYDGDQPIVVHCRGQTPAAAAALLRRRDPRIRILLDVRGAQADEARGGGLLGWFRRRQADRALSVALASADALNTVSRQLAKHLHETGLLTRDLPSSVVGCCADATRFHFDPAVRARTRQELDFGKKFVVCYCGSMVKYQRPDAIAQAIAAILRGISDAHCLIVSQEGGTLGGFLATLGVKSERITLRAAKHDQVARYLMAADIGLLLRENTLTNQVASPVKFAEYLRCGLPVILTAYVGDFSAFVAQEGVGQTVAFPPQAEEVVQAARNIRTRLAAEGDPYRERCSRIAGENFSWEGQIGQLIGLYEKLSQ